MVILGKRPVWHCWKEFSSLKKRRKIVVPLGIVRKFQYTQEKKCRKNKRNRNWRRKRGTQLPSSLSWRRFQRVDDGMPTILISMENLSSFGENPRGKPGRHSTFKYWLARVSRCKFASFNAFSGFSSSTNRERNDFHFSVTHIRGWVAELVESGICMLLGERARKIEQLCTRKHYEMLQRLRVRAPELLYRR